MNEKIQESQKSLKGILIFSASIILFACLEALMMAKDGEYFREFVGNNPGVTFQDYLNLVSFSLISLTIHPVVTALYTYFSRQRGFNMSYRIFFGAMTLFQLGNYALKFRFASIFYYLILLFHLLLFIAIIKMPIRKVEGI